MPDLLADLIAGTVDAQALLAALIGTCFAFLFFVAMTGAERHDRW